MQCMSLIIACWHCSQGMPITFALVVMGSGVLAFRAMGDIKDVRSTAIYAWTTLISVLICVPGALILEGPKLQAGIDAALKKQPNFYLSLLIVGLLYHLYNQVSIWLEHSHHACTHSSM